jgi:hypothetical protein
LQKNFRAAYGLTEGCSLHRADQKTRKALPTKAVVNTLHLPLPELQMQEVSVTAIWLISQAGEGDSDQIMTIPPLTCKVWPVM